MLRVLLIWAGILGAVIVYEMMRPEPASLMTPFPDNGNVEQ